MGSCTRRHFLLTICTFQLITIIERQVFDFLGFMWAPILANFFHIIFVIFGFFGSYQFRAKYIVTYAIWNLFWIGWNALLVCFYLSVGILDKDSVFLNFGSVSWFESNGYGCQPVFSTNFTAEIPVWPIRPTSVDNCLLDYEFVEIAHSGVQLALSVLALLGSILIAKMFYDEDDRFDFVGGNAKSPQHTVVHPMYVSYSSIPSSVNSTFSPKRTNTLTFNTNPKKSTQPPPPPPPHQSAMPNVHPKTTNLTPQPQTVLEYGFASHPPYSSSLSKSSSNTNYLNTNHHHHNQQHHNGASKLAAAKSPPHSVTPVGETFGVAGAAVYGWPSPQQQQHQQHTTSDHNRLNIRYMPVPSDKLSNLSRAAQSPSSPPPLPPQQTQQQRQLRCTMDGCDCGQNNGDPYIQDFDSQGDLAIPPHNVGAQRNQALDEPTIVNYEMPKSYPYVTRSPLRTRAAGARTARFAEPLQQQQQLRSPMNFVDQIREPPPGYRPVQVMRMGSMQRTKSHDRIAQRRLQQAGGGKQRLRPRSYCSNVVSDSFMNA